MSQIDYFWAKIFFKKIISFNQHNTFSDKVEKFFYIKNFDLNSINYFVWCRKFQYRFYNIYSISTTYCFPPLQFLFGIVDVEGLTLICHQSNLYQRRIFSFFTQCWSIVEYVKKVVGLGHMVTLCLCNALLIYLWYAPFLTNKHHKCINKERTQLYICVF